MASRAKSSRIRRSTARSLRSSASWLWVRRACLRGLSIASVRRGRTERARGQGGGGQAVPARHLVGEDEQEEVLGRQRLLAHEGEALGERVEDAREPEATAHGLQG